MAAELQDDEPLDPKVEAIRQKMMRLLMVSGGIMLVGFMALMITIVYKINQGSGSSSSGVVAEGAVALPSGSRIVGTHVAGDRIILTLELADGAKAIHIFTLDGKPVSQLQVENK